MNRYFKRHLGLLVLVFVLSATAQSMIAGQAIFQQILIDQIIGGTTNYFLQILVIAAIFTLVLGGVYMLGDVSQHKFSERFKKSLREDLYTSIMKRDRSKFESIDTAAYISHITNDVNAVVSISKLAIGMLGGALMGSVTALVIMIIHSPILATLAVSVSLASILIPIIFTKAMQKQQVTISQNNANFTTELKEIFTGHEVISSFNLFDIFRNRFALKNNILAKNEFKYDRLSSGTTSISHILAFASTLAMILVAGLMTINGTATVGTLVMFTTLSGIFGAGLRLLMQLLPHIRGVKPVSDMLVNIVDEDNNEHTGDAPVQLDNKIEINNLSFGYTKDTHTLKNLNLIVNKNEKVAIVGESGSGKTTLLRLLSGEYKNYTGQILFDNKELKTLSIKDLRRTIVAIHQEVYIFNDTILNNICLGIDFSQDDLNRALELSGVNKFINSTPNNLDTQCGEAGANLSGGQRQRIALARALIRNAQVLVLDEGTSAIDVATSNEIEQELIGMPELTLLTVTHRMKDGLNHMYDKIIYIENGQAQEKIQE